MLANTFPFKTTPQKDTTSQYDPRSGHSQWRDHRPARGAARDSVVPEVQLEELLNQSIKTKNIVGCHQML